MVRGGGCSGAAVAPAGAQVRVVRARHCTWHRQESGVDCRRQSVSLGPDHSSHPRIRLPRDRRPRRAQEPGPRAGPSHLLRFPMKRVLYALLVVPILPVLPVVPVFPVLPPKCGEIILATTASPRNSGLRDSLRPSFKPDTCIAENPTAVGTSAAL